MPIGRFHFNIFIFKYAMAFQMFHMEYLGAEYSFFLFFQLSRLMNYVLSDIVQFSGLCGYKFLNFGEAPRNQLSQKPVCIIEKCLLSSQFCVPFSRYGSSSSFSPCHFRTYVKVLKLRLHGCIGNSNLWYLEQNLNCALIGLFTYRCILGEAKVGCREKGMSTFSHDLLVFYWLCGDCTLCINVYINEYPT